MGSVSCNYNIKFLLGHLCVGENFSSHQKHNPFSRRVCCSAADNRRMGFRFGLKEGRWLGVGSNGGSGEARIDLAVSDGGGGWVEQ